jgi:3',5'-cyclic-AMP phosphodiesterase
MLLAQITDLHVTRRTDYGLDTAAALERCVDQVAGLDPRPDLCLVTGDIVESGDASEYALAREILARLPTPYYVIPGNHDERGTFREAFSDHAYLPRDGEFLHYTLEEWPLRIIALDTVIPRQTEGTLCEARLQWLAKQLAREADRPTLIMMHHPPFRTGSRAIDEASFTNREALGEIIARHWNIEAMLCGHVHRAMQSRFFGTLASACPSPAHQVALDFRPEAELAFTHEPPGFQLHVWLPGQNLVMHTVCVGQFGGPFPY